MLNTEPENTGDDLGVTEINKHNENSNREDIEEETFDNTNLPLGQWVNMPRRSRRVAREDVVEPFIDVDPSENHGTINESNGVTMLHKATGNLKMNTFPSNQTFM